jgi:hypothetical protein
MIDLAAIWKEMEVQASPSNSGKYTRRIYPDSTFDLFITLEKPSNHRALQFEVPLDSLSGLNELPSTRVLTSRLEKNLDTGEALLELELVDARFTEVFTILVKDLSAVIISSETPHKAVNQFLLRLQHWILFLEHSGPDGLSPEAQRGLYGELWFLKNYLLNRLDHSRAISAWTGPDSTPQDFQLPGAAVEVKVTTAKLPHNLMISNERQLDDTAVETLLLLHLTLDARKSSGETLNKIVDALRTVLKPFPPALQIFELALLKVGYLDVHRPRYDSTGYFIQNSEFFLVTAGFPRIIESGLPVGVGNVHYSIELSACQPFITDKQTVISTILKGA